MSLVDDKIRRFDALLDKYQLIFISSRKSSIVESDGLDVSAASPNDDTRIAQLKNVVRSFSTAAASRPLLKRRKVKDLLLEIRGDKATVQAESAGDETDLQWLATGKATVQVYGIILNTLLEQTIPLGESMWYWDDVLGSPIKTGLYMLQTSPIRFWDASKDVYREATSKYQTSLSLRGVQDAAEQSKQSITQGWQEFYRLVQESVRDRSLAQARTRILTPFALSRSEARQKLDRLKNLKEQSATAIGLLVDEGLAFPDFEPDQSNQEWRLTIARSVLLLENILQHSSSLSGVAEYENSVIESVDTAEQGSVDHPSQLATRLIHIMDDHLPEQESSTARMTMEFGKPSRWVRYWIPGVLLLLSGSTLLRIFANRKAEIKTWIREAGQTAIDFWYNWVVEPTKKLVGTIRHDENAELALMSRDSLRSDRESLERMVVDFAIENPENGTSYSEAEVAQIRTKVKEGDLTPVLRAYEQDMKSPVVRAVTGNLIRTLLIQIQKTKVDVEVAIGGIDSLLKSQELLFGFVGVAPGILLSYFAVNWLRGALWGRRGLQQLQQQGETIRVLRSIDRTLTNCTPTEHGMLSYKDHGLLICDAQILRQRASKSLPGRVQREFLEDLHDLLDYRQGVHRQTKVLERIQWAYAKWLR